MTYKVVKRTVPAMRDGKPLGFDVDRFYATFYGGEPKTSGPFQDPFAEVWADGSITAHWMDQSLWLYVDQWLGIINAVQAALESNKAKRSDLELQWLTETADSKEFEGVTVDLSRNETIAALTDCPIEIEQRTGEPFPSTSPFIFYNGVRRHLSRTDLLDDVCTSWVTDKTAEQWRKHYLSVAQTCYGARLYNSNSRTGFAVIDSLSDG